MKRLVLAGAGHAHVEVLRALGESRPADVHVILVGPARMLTYTGMLPGYVAGHYTLADCTIDLEPLVRRAGVELSRSAVSLVSPGKREIICEDGTSLPYDVLSLNVGSVPRFGGVAGAERHAHAVRPLPKLVAAWDEVLERARGASMGSLTLVGGGAGGVELAFAMEHRLRNELAGRAPHVRLVSDTKEILPDWPWAARAAARARLEGRGVGVHANAAVTEVGRDFVSAGGNRFATDAVFWTAGAAAPEWIRDSGLATDERGYALTNAYLQSTSHPEVFAVGDCAVQKGNPLPRAGVFAVRAAPFLARNLVAAATGQPLVPHWPSPRYLALLSTGRRHAIGRWGGIAFAGDWAWRWKDRIDRRWMARYRAIA